MAVRAPNGRPEIVPNVPRALITPAPVPRDSPLVGRPQGGGGARRPSVLAGQCSEGRPGLDTVSLARWARPTCAPVPKRPCTNLRYPGRHIYEWMDRWILEILSRDYLIANLVTFLGLREGPRSRNGLPLWPTEPCRAGHRTQPMGGGRALVTCRVH